MSERDIQPKRADGPIEEPLTVKRIDYDKMEHQWGTETIFVNGQPMIVTFPLEDK